MVTKGEKDEKMKQHENTGKIQSEKEPGDTVNNKEGEIQELRIKLQESEKLASDYLGYLQRLQADFENYKKRVLKEKEAMREIFLESFATGLLPVADNFERALKASESTKDIQSFVSGMQLIYKSMLEFLKRNNIAPITLEEMPFFDPSLHEAVAFSEVEDEKEEGKIVEEYEKGYRLSGKVIRPAKVKVARCIKRGEETPEKEEQTFLS